jgi:hypothetical protein
MNNGTQNLWILLKHVGLGENVPIKITTLLRGGNNRKIIGYSD